MPSLVYVPEFVLPSYRTTRETQASQRASGIEARRAGRAPKPRTAEHLPHHRFSPRVSFVVPFATRRTSVDREIDLAPGIKRWE